MKRVWLISFFILAISLARSGYGADNELSAKEKALGWQLLFDGKDFAGWANRGKEEVKGWVVEGGAMKRTGGGGDIVYVGDQFENFEMSIDWKAEGNSGVFIRMSSQEDWLNTGMEIQVLPRAGKGKHAAGSLYDLVAPSEEAEVKEGGWNNFYIVCDGPVIFCRMNGVETFRIDLRDEKWRRPQGKFNKPYASLPRRGWIMLQDHGAAVEYKNVKIRPIAVEEAGREVFLDPLRAGEVFELQGEYVGRAGDGKVGAQIVALGEDKFAAVFYPGGLPGAGWEEGEGRILAEGKLEDGTVRFENDSGRVTLEGGRIEGRTSEGERVELEKKYRVSPTLGAEAPRDAVVLFDGTDVSHWAGGEMDARDYLKAGARTQESYGDFQLHLEFLLPLKPEARGQARGNSGVYVQGRYEVQVLDSFGLEGKSNECGGLYRQKAPRVNMCLPPLSWQTYDIDFQAARFDDSGKKVRNSQITVRHNGELIHDGYSLSGPTGAGRAETPEPRPIQLQDHGNPVFYRNIWIITK